jgi:hypothetical protein
MVIEDWKLMVICHGATGSERKNQLYVYAASHI